MSGLWCKVVRMMVALLLFGGTASAAGPDGVESRVAEQEGEELIVKYRPGGKARREEFHRRHGTRRVKEFLANEMERVKIRPGVSLGNAVKELENDPDVEYAEPNYRLRAFSVPSDPSFPALWGMAKIKAPAAWNSCTGSNDVVVAVIDSGIDYNHPDLKGNLWMNGAELNGKQGVDDDGNGVVDDIYGFNAITGGGDPFDDQGHGTHVAGTIGAVGDNGVGVAGVNWNVRIMACKFLDDSEGGTTADAIDCLHYVAEMRRRGVNVVATNNSWGGERNSRALSEAINAQREILFVAAAGNDGTDNDSTPSYPANYNLPNIVAVAATTSADNRASYSQYGRRSVHVGAPGSSIYSTYPGNRYISLSGTSMAAPHVTGLAALIKAARPSADWRGVRNLLLSGGEPLPSLVGKTVSGRRIDTFGSLYCLDSRVFSALRFPKTVKEGVPAILSAVSIDCDAPLGPVTVALSDGEVIELKDDGVSPDQVAADGNFTAIFTPPRYDETFFFSSPAGSELVGASIVPTADLVPPMLTLNWAATPTRETSLVVTGSVEVGIIPTVTVPAAASSGPVAVSGENWSCPVSGLTTGDNVITVQAVDPAGNVTTRAATVLVILPDGAITGAGAVTLADALRAMQVTLGIFTPTPEELMHGDVAPMINGVPAPDGRIDIADVLLILKKALNILTF